jgi:hypothetical protein
MVKMACTVRLIWTVDMIGKAVDLRTAAVIEKQGLRILTKRCRRARGRNGLVTRDSIENIPTMTPLFRFQRRRHSS